MDADPLPELLRSCVVRIDIGDAFLGTGFFISPGRILTCAHVTVHRGRFVNQLHLEWEGRRAEAAVVKRYPAIAPDSPDIAFWPYPDLAVLEVESDAFAGHPCVLLGTADPDEWPPDRLYTYGYTKGEHAADVVSATSATLKYEGPLREAGQRYLKLKYGEVLHGMSGGPLLNVRAGQVSAIVESRRTGSAVAGGFGVPVSIIYDEIAEENTSFHRADRRWRMARARTAGIRPLTVRHPHTLLGDRHVVGRDAELATLQGWLDAEGPPVFCVSGPGGQGKSALAWSLLNRSQGVRVWHSFGLDTHHEQALTESILRAVHENGMPELDLTGALETLGDLGVLVVLDQVDSLFGPSSSLIDMLTPQHRVLADPRVEALIRRLASTRGVRLLLTTRLRPAFLDDPAFTENVGGFELQPLDGLDSAVLWAELGISGSRADAVAASTLLRGNPLLISVAARKLAYEQSADLRTWLQTDATMLDDVLRKPQFQEAVLSGAFETTTDRFRDLLLVLAASRRRLDLEQWRSLAVDLEPLTDLSRLVAEGLERGLVHRAGDDRFELHDLVADASLQLADVQRLKQIYGRLDEQRGLKLFMPGFPAVGEYDRAVIDLSSLDELDNDLAYLRCLLDRNLLRDAEQIFSENLFQGLRFRLGELRTLERIVGSIRAAHARAGRPADVAPHTALLASLAVLDARPDDALAMLPEGDQLTAEALILKGDLEAAYVIAEHAAYSTLRALTLIGSADYTGFQMLGDKLFYDYSHALIEHVLCLRTLASVLTQLGCVRSACAVMAEALAFVEGSNQPGISSMAFEAAGRVLLAAGEVAAARVACDAASEAARSMQVTEHVLNAAVLDLEIRARTDEVGEQALDLLIDTIRRGFGLLAHRCLALVDADEPGQTLRATAVWQLRGFSPAPARADAGSMADELDRLEPLHPPRRWMEWRCLRRRAWLEEGFAHELHEAVARMVGDVDLPASSAPFDVDEAAVGEHGAAAINFDDLLRALPYAATDQELRRLLMNEATTADQLRALMGELINIAAVQTDSAAALFEASNCARRLGEFGHAALMADSGFRAMVTFRRTTPSWVRLPLVVGFGLDLLKQEFSVAQAVQAVKFGLQGGPLITADTVLSNHFLKILGSEEAATYASAAEVATGIAEMNMTGAFMKLEKGSVDWWAARIVEDALTSRRRVWARCPDDAAREAAENLIDAVARIKGHAEHRRTIELTARMVLT